ncbi:MAG: XRE family transcriptional regulator [Gammaproteobacteria bacterium]|nr:MAG: XRE family transcriptional regulator [Gammaproteobacteria bacterium]
MASVHDWIYQMAKQDKQFYIKLGKRIADARKEHDLTQVQLAEVLGISQQTMAHYEGGKLRIAASMLPTISRILKISFEELMEDKPKTKAAKRGPASALERQIEQVRQLPRSKQKFVMEMIDTVIQQTAN